jgi:hypothetical protein
MARGTRGTVVSVSPQLREQRLKVVAAVRTDSGEVIQAYMPDREISAILPRSVLVGESRVAPVSLMETVGPILARMTEGRTVRVWQYKERRFFSFQQWKGVRFRDDAEQGPGAASPAGRDGELTREQGQTARPA